MANGWMDKAFIYDSFSKFPLLLQIGYLELIALQDMYMKKEPKKLHFL